MLDGRRISRIGGVLAASAEGDHLGYFAPHEIPEPLAGGGHDQAIRAWQKSKQPPQLAQMDADEAEDDAAEDDAARDADN